jgi:hypothetical protein
MPQRRLPRRGPLVQLGATQLRRLPARAMDAPVAGGQQPDGRSSETRAVEGRGGLARGQHRLLHTLDLTLLAVG